MNYNVVIIDARKGSHLDFNVVEAVEDATLVYVIESDRVRAIPGEKFEGEMPAVTASFYEATSEGELSLRKAQKEAADRDRQRERLEGEDPLVKAGRVWEKPDA